MSGTEDEEDHVEPGARKTATAWGWWGLLAMDIRTKGRVERWIEPPVLSYILQRPIHSWRSTHCEYVLYRMYYRYRTERRNSLSAPLGNVMVGSSRWWGLLAMDIRTNGRVERWIEPPVLSYILQEPIHS
jgi:hypothetical protein